ncbi:MAG: hypothetical protein ABI646_07725, partial [Acidobacteriota bacterium]
MRSRNFITDDLFKTADWCISKRARSLVAFAALFLLPAANVVAQRVAILTPQKTAQDADYSQRLSESLPNQLKILDRSQSETAFRTVQIGDVYNMGLDEAKAAAAVIGCDYFVIVRTGTQRRSSFSRGDYYEAFSVHYVVSGRTGGLVSWFLKSFEADDQDKAFRTLAASIDNTSKEIVNKIRSANVSELRSAADAQIEEVPDTDSPASKDLKPPI